MKVQSAPAVEQGQRRSHRGWAVSLDSVSKVFGHGPNAVRALENVSLEIGMGEFLCLVGASGCGKSTLLNLIAGLDRPTTGTVEVRGGRTSLMFQEGALFPWLSVEKNVELALKLRGVAKHLRKETLAALLDMVHLTEFSKRHPHDLSGGMRQRVALARALAQQAEVLLMDEPFGALDAMTRDLLHEELENLWQNTGFTVVFVTHNVREAVRLGDRVVVLSSRPGRVIAEFPVAIERPRRTESAEVGKLAGLITKRLRQEVRRHG
ncbi:MAG: ABC transporter ATP-binding protein [Actinomycetota bacterium]|nr:ABC transporter ATP-binding protein [Actinomycetota bacterium]